MRMELYRAKQGTQRLQSPQSARLRCTVPVLRVEIIECNQENTSHAAQRLLTCRLPQPPHPTRPGPEHDPSRPRHPPQDIHCQ